MKKLLVTGIALVAILMFAMPAAATKVELGGYYRVEGRYQANPTLNEDTQDGGAAWRHRFRLTPAFIVSDALRFDFKMDIFDGTKFGSTGSEAKSTAVIDVDRLWMTITAPFGKFALGRMAGGAWGLDFLNNNEDYDRVRFDTKFGNVSTGIILQKNAEGDWGSGNGSDSDTDVYYLYGVYKADFGAIGLLGAYVNGKSSTNAETTAYNLLPYFDVKFGGLGLRGELKWANGEIDPDAAGDLTTDTEELAWTLQADYSFGAFTVGGGYAWVQGEDLGTATTLEKTNASGGGLGDDWGLFVVATDVDQIVNDSGDPFGIITTGVQMWYVDAEWNATKAWNFGVRVGGFTAQEVAAGVDDKIGTEFDGWAEWKVMKNLKWGFYGGYFDAGDYFKSGITNIDNTYTVKHVLTLRF
ncbi:MAG: porin [Desulfobacterales bacterium]|nr:porin [Desulfobacterales bacterium]